MSERDGVIQAARWSIERLRRPSAPGLVWLGYAKPEIQSFACLACGTEGFKQGVLRSEGRTLYICPECASHQFHPPQPRRTTPDVFAIRYQLEYAADVPGAAAGAARATECRKRGRLIELGGRLGYLVDIVRHMPGWTAVGVDPGPWPAVGAVRLGSAMLHGNVETVLGQAEQGGKFDVVVAENIVDRSLDPRALLRALPEISMPGARWLVAVPDAAVLYAARDGDTVRRTASEARVMIPSRIGWARLLERAGLGELAVTGDGTVLRADRNAEADLPPQAGQAVLDQYLARRVGAPPEDASAAAGMLVRAVERAAARGDWEAGRKLYARALRLIEAAAEAARSAEDHGSLESLFRSAPVAAPSLLLHTGLVHLNTGGNPSTQAMLHFQLAATLARRAYALSPALMRPEADRQWEASLQFAVVLRDLGDLERAQSVFQSVVSGSPGSVWANRARAALETPLQPADPAAVARAAPQSSPPPPPQSAPPTPPASVVKPRPVVRGGTQRRAT
jgi:tetratricopeptide (TPR) repeat protein